VCDLVVVIGRDSIKKEDSIYLALKIQCGVVVIVSI
jgi:hypothetical protein